MIFEWKYGAAAQQKPQNSDSFFKGMIVQGSIKYSLHFMALCCVKKSKIEATINPENMDNEFTISAHDKRPIKELYKM